MAVYFIKEIKIFLSQFAKSYELALASERLGELETAMETLTFLILPNFESCNPNLIVKNKYGYDV